MASLLLLSCTKYKVQANAEEIIPGETLYIYKRDTKTGKYTMVNAKEYKVTKAGTVTVKAVVTLKNGTKKTVKMTIKVK